jgi:hypothetical protein
MAAGLNNSTGHSRHPLPLQPVDVAHQPSDGQALHAPVLVLNTSYEPINVCAARRAIVLVLKGVAMTEEENGHFLHAARFALRVPSVIRLLEYRRIPIKRVRCRAKISFCVIGTPASTVRKFWPLVS